MWESDRLFFRKIREKPYAGDQSFAFLAHTPIDPTLSAAQPDRSALLGRSGRATGRAQAPPANPARISARSAGLPASRITVAMYSSSVVGGPIGMPGRRQTGSPHARLMPVADQRDDGHTHPKRFTGGRRAVIRKRIERDVDVVVTRQMLRQTPGVARSIPPDRPRPLRRQIGREAGRACPLGRALCP
jgi:hypothetical protein